MSTFGKNVMSARKRLSVTKMATVVNSCQRLDCDPDKELEKGRNLFLPFLAAHCEHIDNKDSPQDTSLVW